MLTKFQICLLLLILLCLQKSEHVSETDQKQKQSIIVQHKQNQNQQISEEVQKNQDDVEYYDSVEDQEKQKLEINDALELKQRQILKIMNDEQVQNKGIEEQGEGKSQKRQLQIQQDKIIKKDQKSQNQEQRVNQFQQMNDKQQQQGVQIIKIQEKQSKLSQQSKQQPSKIQQKQQNSQTVQKDKRLIQQKLNHTKQIIKQWSINTSSQNSNILNSTNSNTKPPPLKLTYHEAAIGLYISFFIQHFPSIIKSKLKTHIFPYLPTQILTTLQNFHTNLIDKIIRKLPIIAHSYYKFYKILIDDSLTPKPKKVYYQNNYANLYGGAKIIMKSSNKIKSINSILEDGPDKYMYTDQKLPLKIIIGLNQQIAIQSIIIQSYQMYSCIAKEFKVQGKFTMEDKKWVYLGTYKAENVFGDQQFYTERKLVRYIKLTFLSSYGKWSYFTLTQVKIKGRNLFADALSELNQKKQPSSTNSNQPPSQSHQHEHESHKQQQQDRPSNICLNEFKPLSEQPHQSNLIKSLITKIDSLQSRNTVQNKQLQSLNTKFHQMNNLLYNKTVQNKFYEQMLIQYRANAQKSYYVIVCSVVLSVVTLCCLICLCLIRRRELTIGALSKNNGDHGQGNDGEGKFVVKKSSSFK